MADACSGCEVAAGVACASKVRSKKDEIRSLEDTNLKERIKKDEGRSEKDRESMK